MGLVLVGIVLRLLIATLHQVTPISDFAIYSVLAGNIAHHGDYTQDIGGDAEVYWPVGWPLVLAAAYKLFGTDPTVGEVVAALLSSGALAITALLASALLKRPFAIAAIAVVALNPAWISYTSVLGTEHLAGLLVVAVLALVTLLEPDWRVGIAIGVLVALLILTRADIGFAMLVALGVAFIGFGVRRHWRVAVATAFAVIVGLTPWVVRNELVFGQFIFTSMNGGETFYHASYEIRNQEIPDPDPAPSFPIAHDPRAWDMYYWRLGLRHVREDPVAWMGYNVARIGVMWGNDAEVLGWTEVTAQTPGAGAENLLGDVVDWVWRVVAVLALVGGIAVLTLTPAWRRAWLPILALSLCTVLITMMFVPQPRRHLPVVAPVTLLAGLGAQACGMKLRRQSDRVKAAS